MRAELPPPKLFEEVCQKGLSMVRPLLPSAAQHDPQGWNFGSARPPSYWAYGRLRALLAMSEAKALHPKRVFEVAAGDGALCACLQQMGCEVVANDLRRENLEQSVAGFHNHEQIRIVPGNVFELSPSLIGQFDLVIACEVIEHVAHAVDLLRQLRQFVTPNGHILLTTPNGAYFRNKLPTYSQVKNLTELESRQFKPDADGHLFLITPEELRQIGADAGLEVKRLIIWGTPFISGESGLRFLSPLSVTRWWYRLEVMCQDLSGSVLRRLANSMSVVLTPTSGTMPS